MTDDFSEYDAPEGKVWVCGACGKHGPNRATIGDEACFLNAVLCEGEKVNDHWVAAKEAEP